MKLKNLFRKLLCQYQTRQHLSHLPEHLYEDIKISHQDIAAEISKNSVISIMLRSAKRLLRGA